jgi:hypothetical protein
LSLDDAKTTKGSITATATCRSVMAEAVVVLHAFQKRTQETSRQDIGLARRRWAQLVKEPQMASKANAAKKSTETFASVWDALADTPEQAANLRARSELMRQNAWVGLAAPARTPRDIVDRLNDAVNKAMAEPAMQSRLKFLGMTSAAGTPGAFAETFRAEQQTWANVMKRANLTTQ